MHGRTNPRCEWTSRANLSDLLRALNRQFSQGDREITLLGLRAVQVPTTSLSITRLVGIHSGSPSAGDLTEPAARFLEDFHKLRNNFYLASL